MRREQGVLSNFRTDLRSDLDRQPARFNKHARWRRRATDAPRSRPASASAADTTRYKDLRRLEGFASTRALGGSDGPAGTGGDADADDEALVSSASASPAVSSAVKPVSRPHSWVYSMLNARSRKRQAVVYRWAITILILVDVFVFIASTEPDLQTPVGQRFFYGFEAMISTVFLVEYLLRLVTCTERRAFAQPCRGRLRYLLSASALLDATATFPFFVELFLPRGKGLPTLTWLRLFRLLLIMKTQKFAQAMSTSFRVVYLNAEILGVALCTCLILVLFTSTALYFGRPGNSTEGEFRSITSTSYLSIMMLTGQGEPDEDGGPLPWWTKTIIVITATLSVAMFAIPASMLTWGFEAEAARLAQKNFKRRRQQRERAAAHARHVAEGGDCAAGEGGMADSSTDSSSMPSSSAEDDSDQAWAEYEAVLKGDDIDNEGSDGAGSEGAGEETKASREAAFKSELQGFFKRIDVDASGTLDMDEFEEFVKVYLKKNQHGPNAAHHGGSEGRGATGGGGTDTSGASVPSVAPVEPASSVSAEVVSSLAVAVEGITQQLALLHDKIDRLEKNTGLA